MAALLHVTGNLLVAPPFSFTSPFACRIEMDWFENS
jgi:hypothetical protein